MSSQRHVLFIPCITGLHMVYTGLQAVEILQLVVDQQGTTADQQTVCSLLQVCKAWRTAVQQCKSGQVSIVISGVSWKTDRVGRSAARTQWMQRFTAATSWLRTYPGLVGSVSLSPSHVGQAAWETAINLLASTLHESAPRMRKPWALSIYSINEQLMSSLAATNVTALIFSGSADDWFEVAPMVTQLTKLQQLSAMEMSGAIELSQSIVTSDLLSLTGLQSLSMLELHCPASGINVLHIPTQLTSLGMYYEIEWEQQEPLAWVLQRLPQLQQLTIKYWFEYGNLKQLESLAPQLTALQEVKLTPEWATMMLGSGTWLGRLPALQSLWIDNSDNNTLERDEFVDFIADLASTTTLTRLELLVELEPNTSCVGEQLARLTTLQYLYISKCPKMTPEGAQQLTQLTSLTYLDLGPSGVDDAGLSLIALHLTNLKHLAISRSPDDEEEFGLGPMPILARLSGLTHLTLNGDMQEHTAQLALRYMTGLSQLEKLGGAFTEAGDEALEEFWAAVQGEDEFEDQ